MLPSRLAPVTVAALALAGLAGCAPGGSQDIKGDTVTVYVSAPLSGPRHAAGAAIENGARLALGDAGRRAGELRIKAVFLDDARGADPGMRFNPVAVAANARRAAQDTTAIAYLGELESGATRTSLPITNQAMMLQVSPASTAVGLARTGPGAADEVPTSVQTTGDRTFGRVIPDDERQAEAAAGWARRLGARRAAVISDGTAFGDTVSGAFVDQAEAEGIAVAADERDASLAEAVRAARRARPDIVYYGGTGAGADPALARVAAAAPRAKLLAPDALLFPSLPSRLTAIEPRLRITSSAENPAQLPATGRRFLGDYRRRFGAAADPYAAYGYEAMAVALDSIARAGGQGEDRGAVISEFLGTRDRHSVLGTYSIDGAGNTTLRSLAGYRVRGGEPMFETPLHAP